MYQSETRVGWQDYLAIILRRRWFFVVPCAVVVALSLIVGMILPKVYRAETILMIQDQQVINPLIEGLAVSTPVGERLRTLREEILSWTSLSRLARELKLDKDATSPLAFEKMIKRLQSTIDVRMRGLDLVTVSYEDHDPVLSQMLVNTITTIYMQRNQESETAETGTAIQFIESEMAVYKKKLEDAEHALRDFKELYVMQMPVANQINEEVVNLEVQLAQLLVENTDAHPTVIQVRRHVDDLKKKRNEEIRRVIVAALAKGSDPRIYEDMAHALDEPAGGPDDKDPALRSAKEAYRAWVERLDSSLAGGQAAPTQVQIVTSQGGGAAGGAGSVGVIGTGNASISLGPREEQELARLTRDYNVYSETYQHMQQRLERAKVTQRLGESDEGSKFKVLEPARLPLRPARPDLAKIFIFSLLLGIFLGAGVAFVAEYLDQSFQNAEDLQAAIELPVLGSISTIVTEQDVVERKQRRDEWLSLPKNRDRAKQIWDWVRASVVTPAWGVVDRALVRWGL